ncbi:MAG: UDP-N-acetylmuramoyl-L-alanine--D-glutamate ligase [Lysobacteraceae bacterium]
MRLSQLEGRRVALWGFGLEGRALWRALRGRFPDQRLTVFCPDQEQAALAALGDPLLDVRGPPTLDELRGHEVIVKSPGISPYRPPADAARAAGLCFTSGTALWFAENLPGRRLCVTGTKGKSTTTALIAHLLRAGGIRTALAGNIGLPLMALIDPPEPPAVWAIELSSYQAGDALRPDVAMVLNLFPEHLDWHGSEQRYIDDKLALITRAQPRRVVLNWLDPRLRELGEGLPGCHWIGREDGWHLRGEAVHRGDQCVLTTAPPALRGRHNAFNLCAALAAIEALALDATGEDAGALAVHAADFKPLPHRLQWLGRRDGIDYIDDSIATTPHASLAALDSLAGRRIAIIVGGFDRGLDWTAFAERAARDGLAAIVSSGQNGPRIHALLQAQHLAPGIELIAARNLVDAVPRARQAVGTGGVVLLSPGAPSFPDYRDYAHRGRHFAELAAFDPTASDISGLGIA